MRPAAMAKQRYSRDSTLQFGCPLLQNDSCNTKNTIQNISASLDKERCGGLSPDGKSFTSGSRFLYMGKYLRPDDPEKLTPSKKDNNAKSKWHVKQQAKSRKIRIRALGPQVGSDEQVGRKIPPNHGPQKALFNQSWPPQKIC